MNLTTFKEARNRIKDLIIQTPLISIETLNERIGKKVYLKCENFQVTGSFKIRGCLNSMLLHGNGARITRSSGNFAGALAWSGQKLGIPVTVVMPTTAPQVKIQRAKESGAEVILFGTTHFEGEEKAKEIVEKRNIRFTSPYNDEDVIIGQGSIALEIYEELPTVKHLLIPIGGGGSIAGSALAMKLQNSHVEMIAVEPVGAKDFYLSRQSGILTSFTPPDTIADGLRTPMVGPINWPILQKNVDHVQLVNDAQIIEAMKLLFETAGIVAEPSGAASLAAVIANKERLNQGDIVCVISGGNVDKEAFINWVN